jgi:hypothetical protein
MHILWLLMALPLDAMAREPLAQWLSTSGTAQWDAIAVYCGCGIAGILGHYGKKWVTGDIKGNLYVYLVKHHPKRSMLMVGAFLSTAAGYIFSGALADMSWGVIMSSSLTAGYAADSLCNKGPAAEPDDPPEDAETIEAK